MKLRHIVMARNGPTYIKLSFLYPLDLLTCRTDVFALVKSLKGTQPITLLAALADISVKAIGILRSAPRRNPLPSVSRFTRVRRVTKM